MKLPELDKSIAENTEKMLAEPAYTLGGRVKFPDGINGGYRTLYPIYRDGQMLAFVGVRLGFGKGWKVWPLRLAPAGARFHIEGAQPDDSNHNQLSIFTHSKDHAIQVIKDYVAKGWRKFPSLNELKTAAQQTQDNEVALAKQILDSQIAARKTLERQIAVFDKVMGTNFVAQVMTVEEWTDLGAIKNRLTNELALAHGRILSQEKYVDELRTKSQTTG